MTYVVNDIAPSEDTVAPTEPSGLTASANFKQVSLSWLASSDNVGVAGYHVFRDGAMIADTANTGYTDQNALDGMIYAYSVNAYDAAGNTSPQSDTVMAGKVKAKAKGRGGGSGGGKGKGPNK